VKYPTYAKHLKFRHTPALDVDATVSLDGRPLVVINSENLMVEDLDLTPTEADRLAEALAQAAACARAKIAHVKRRRS
jgi:hypothetical protein